MATQDNTQYYQGWQIGGSGYWYDPISWTGMTIPPAGGTVIITTPGPAVGPTPSGSNVGSLDNVTINIEPAFSFSDPVLGGNNVTYGAGVTLNFLANPGSGDTTPTAVMAANGMTTFRGAMNLDAPQGSITIDVSGQHGSGTFAIAASATIAVGNSTRLTFSDGVIAGVTNNGVITISDHSMVDSDGPTNGSGQYQLQGGSTLQFDGPVLTGQKIRFLDGTDTLALNAAGVTPLGSGLNFSGVISGFRSGDVIQLLAPKDMPTSVTYLQPYHMLAVRDASGAVVAKLQLDGNYQSNAFALTVDGTGNYAITLAASAVPSGANGNDMSVLSALAGAADLANDFAIASTTASTALNGTRVTAPAHEGSGRAISHMFVANLDHSPSTSVSPLPHGPTTG